MLCGLLGDNYQCIISIFREICFAKTHPVIAISLFSSLRKNNFIKCAYNFEKKAFLSNVLAKSTCKNAHDNVAFICVLVQLC